MLGLLVSTGVAYAQGTPTVPTIESVTVTSDPGEDGGYAIDDEIQVRLTFSEAVTVTSVPQLTLDVGGQNRTAAYSEGSGNAQLVFSYTVLSDDEDADGIAVVANSLVLNGGAIRAGATNATLTHAALQADDHKVDGIAPTVTVGGETRTYVPPGRQFNVVFYFSEKVYGITDAEITVTNGLAVDVKATSGTATWPRYTRWDVIVIPAVEGPVTVTLAAGAGTDAYGNGNAAPDSALAVIAATPVTVEVARTSTGFAEGGKAEFTVTRSRDNGAIPVFLSVAQTGDLLSGAVEVYPPPDPDNPGEPGAPQELTFTETPFDLTVHFAAGEVRKRIAVLTEDDYRVEDDGTVTLSVPARPGQYKYIPGLAPSATADVRDNDVSASASLYWTRSFNPFTGTTLNTALEGHSIFLQVYGFRRARGQPLQVTLSVTEVGSYLDLDGEEASGYQDLGNGQLRVTLPVDRAFENVIIPLMENDVGEADGSVTITIEPDPDRSYTPSVGFSELTVPVRDNDTPSTVSISAPDSITEGGTVSYTLTRTWDPGQSWEELSVNVALAQTGDYITWPAAHQPDADGLVTIPVAFAARSLTATLTLETVDDEVSERNGSVAATIRADAGGSYVTGADSDHTTRLLDNDPAIISVSAVSAVVTEGTDAQFRFTRIGNTGVATRVGLYVGGLPKVMTDATEATVLTSQDRTVHIYGAFVDYILEFAAGETEKTLSFTTEADNVNEGDGWLGVTIVSRFGNPFVIGAGYAQVHVHDDDIPTVSISQVTLPTGAATLEGDTWVGDMPEGQALSWVLSCTGNYEYATRRSAPSTNVMAVQMEHVQFANHPAHYTASRQAFLGLNFLNHPLAGRCDGATRISSRGSRFVGPDGGTETFKLVPKNPAPPLAAEYHEAYRLAKEAADAAGTLVTQRDIIHPSQAQGSDLLITRPCDGELRYCPRYRIGTPHKISLNLINRDPTILIKAESTTVVEGEPARFIVERLWARDLLNGFGSSSETVVALRASQNGQYITGALPAEITFLRTETSKIIELTTVDDSAFGADGSVTIELLPDTTGADLNVQGKYTTSQHWRGHTPEGGRSDRATVAITDNDNKPGVSIGPALGREGDSGSSAWTFVVTLASATDKPVTVNYATSDGTATAGEDYTAVNNGSVTIATGDTTAELDVSVNGDEIDEHDEVFNVTISLPSGTTAAAITGGHNATALGLIQDDDPAVITVAPKADMVKEGEEAVFVLTRAGVIGNPLPIQVRLRAPGRVEKLAVRFERGAATAELAVATEENNLVDYPAVSDYTIEVFGDGEPLDRDDRIFTPGTPATATVRVTDDEVLTNVTVHAVEAVTSWRNDMAYTFRRDGDISQPLSFQYYYYLHKPGQHTDISGPVPHQFKAGDNEVEVVYINWFDSGVAPSYAAANFPWTLTFLVFGDGGWNGLNRIYQGGDPNVATVSAKYDDHERALMLGAETPLWVSVGQTVSIPVTITNTGSVDSSSPISITSVHQSADRDLDGTNEPRMSCQLAEAIAAGQSAVCEVSFLVEEADLTSRNYSRIVLDVTASDGVTTSNTYRIYMRVMDGVSVGFTETGKLSVTEPGFGEANAKASLTVTRVGRSAEAVQVAYTLEPSSNDNRRYTPVEGVDYADNSATPGVITFGNSETEQTITIDILGDQIDEAKERFRVTLVPPEGVLVEEDKRTRIVVIEDATPPSGESYLPTASLLLVSSGPVPESEGPVEFAVVLDREWGIDGRYEIELLDDQLTASAGVASRGIEGDFEDPGVLVVRIPAGQTRFEFSIPLYDDDVREEDETFQLRLGSSIDASFRTIGTPNKALATIADDDRIPPTGVTLSLSHNGTALASMPEATNRRDLTVTASFSRIRWPGDAADAPLRPADPLDVDTTVRIQFDPTSGATHAADLDDFAPLKVEDDQGVFGEVESFDIVIPAGQTSGAATLRFKPVKDDLDEETETVTFQGSELVAGGSEDSLPVRSASFTIIDDDTRGITVSPTSVLIAFPLVEGGAAGTYSLVLDSQPTDTVVITLAGNQGGFLRLIPDTLTFTTSNWATPQTVSVMALDDGIAGGVRPQDLITHQVSGGDYGSETVPNIPTIIEDTTEAFVYLEGGQASESDGYVEFTVTVRPILRTIPVLVRYSTVDGTAMAGSDYTRQVKTDETYEIFTIPAGRSSGAIRIPITDDQVYESADETFTLQLTTHNNKALLDGEATSLTATGTIADDDPKPVVSVSGPAGEVSYISETVKDPVTFTLTLMGQSAGDVTVDFATGAAALLGLLTSRQGPAEATQDEDYGGVSGSVTFTSGQTTKTVTVQVTDDDLSEETEFFGFTISKPQGADLRGRRSVGVADVGLLDDDARGVTIAPTSIDLNEPGPDETAVAGMYTVSLNSRPTDTVTVTIGGGDPAVSLSGDTLTNNRLTFTTTNWNTAQTITVTPVKDDNAVGETVTLSHTPSGGDYAAIAADSVTINVTDSDTRNVVLSRQFLTVTEEATAGSSYTVKLATKPSGAVTVTISGHSGTDLTLSGATLSNNRLTFTVDDWTTAQTVTVKAAEDDDAATDTATLAHTASGGDYAGVTRNLPVTVTDDDTPEIVLSKPNLTVTEGATAGSSYTVKLATKPSGAVTVIILGHNGTDLTLSGATLSNNRLTFTVSNWNTAQTVTVKAGEDDDAATDTARLTHSAAGGDYDNVTGNLGVTVTDDDSAGVRIEPAALSVVAGRSNEYTVVLATEPSGDVTVTVAGHASTDVTVSGSTLSNNRLTFTTTNWETAQTVIVSAPGNAARAKVTLAHAVAGADYGAVTAESVVVSVLATAGQQPTLQVGVSSSTQTLTVPEGGASSYSLVLSSRPTDAVTVGVILSTGTDLTLSATALTFTRTNWDVAQTVTVWAAEDDDAITDAEVTLAHSVSGGGYGSATVPDVEVSITENDTAALVISRERLTVGEEATAGSSYTVKLATKPSGAVTVTISGHSGTDLALSGATLTNNRLTFTVDDWNTAQTVTVKAAHDADAATDTATLAHTASGGGYAGVTRNLPVTVTDNDTLAVVLSETHLTVTEEATAGSSYTVKLATKPSSAVTVTISGHSGTDLALSGATLTNNRLTFTVDDWNTAQTVTVKAAEDDDAATDTATLAHTASGGGYAGVTRNLPVTVTDNDTLAVVLSETHLTVTEEATAGSSYTVKLATKPSSAVTVTISGHSGTDLALSGATLTNNRLTFTVDDWNTAQTVTVKAAHDADAATDAATLTHTASGGGYAGVVRNLPVTVTDNDTLAVVLSETHLTVTEGATAGSSYTVKLATKPSGAVTVTVSGQAGTDLALSGATLTNNRLTFTVDDWNTAQTVTVKAAHDADAATDAATLTHTASGGGYAGVVRNLPVTVTDNDTLAVVLSETHLTVTEGATAGSSYTVKLATKPSSAVTVTISGHSGTDLALSGATLSNNRLTFTVSNWNTAQTVTVKAGEDDDAATDTARLTHSAAGGDYDNVTGNLGVTVTDDDSAGVRIEPAALSVVAGRSNEYTVVLATEPSGDVTVTVAGHASTDVTVSGSTLSNNRLTFTTTNWETAQTVIVSAPGNAARAKVTLAHAVAGADYGAVTAESVVVSVLATAGQQPTLQVGVSSSTQTLTVPEGGASSYSLVLSSRPTDAVTVGVILSTGTDLTLSATALTFTRTNWDVAQTVTVWAAEDDDAITDAEVTLAHSVSGGGYGSATVPDVEVSITENDTAALVISRERLTVGEEATAGSSYTVKLATKPSGAVTVTVSGHSGTDLALSGATLTNNRLTFTTTNWNTAQTVTVKAAHDADAATDTATLAHTASGGGYAGVTRNLPVTVTDNDTLAVVLSETHLTVTEEATAGSSYTVKLATKPSSAVTVTISGHSGTDLALSGATLTNNRLTFTVDDWNTAQTVTVKAAEDDDAATDTATLAHTASGGGYAGVTRNLPVTVTDNDTLAVVLSEMHLTVTEEVTAGSSYTVKLATKPSGAVTVTISGHSGTDLALSGATLSNNRLTFTVDDWNTAQTVTVKAAHDADAATDTATLAHTASGGGYASVVRNLSVTVTDNDTLAIVLSETHLTVTEEATAGSSYTVKLATKPSGAVTVTISGHSGTDLALSGATLTNNRLTFTTTNWNTAQTVTVKAAHDADAATDTATLAHTASGGGYASVVRNLPVTVTDNDTLAIVLSETHLTVTEEATAGSSYTVKLATKPSGAVTVTISGHSGTDLALSGATLTNNRLTFTTTNWNTAQTVTVKAAHDADAATDTATLAHTASGGGYAGVTRNLPVTVTDNDTLAVVLSEMHLTVTEEATAGSSYTVKLATKPSGAVTVTISGHSGTDLALSGATLSNNRLTFTVDDWNTAQTVTVKAAHDADAATDAATLAHTASGGGYAGVTRNLPVTVTDNDTLAVVLSETHLTVTEEATAGSSYTVKLATKPSSAVTVTISGHSGTDLALSGATLTNNRLTFTVDDWTTAQTVTVKAAEDDDAATDTATLAHTASGGDYAGVTRNLPVTVTDDDTPEIVLSETHLTVTEEATAGSSYTVKLATKPSGAVTVTISGHSGTDLALSGATLTNNRLTFTTTNWNTAQTVTVKAAHDADAATDTATLAHTASGGGYAGVTRNLPVTVTDNDDPAVTVSFETDSYTVAEGETVAVMVTLSADSQSRVDIPLTSRAQDGAGPADYTVPASVTFKAGEMSRTIAFSAARDMEDDDGESVVLGFGAMLDDRFSPGSKAETMVRIRDDASQRESPPGNGGGSGTVVTIVRVPDGTVEDSSTFIEGTQALYRLQFEAVGGGPPVGEGVDVELSHVWQNESPLVTSHGQVTGTAHSLPRVDVWDTAVQIHDNDVGNPDGTVTISITGCERSGCIIGTPSVLTLTIADDDGGPVAAVPGPPDQPRLRCAPSGGGYDGTGIAVSWNAPDFVGSAPVQYYELRYRQSSQFLEGKLVEHQWQYWPHGVAATSATITGLMTRVDYTVGVRAVSANGPGLWSESNYFKVGPAEEICRVMDQYFP